MIRSVTIKGYRGLEHLEMNNLGRINLLVGKNNSGKSSVLEALYLLASGGDPSALLRVLIGRGELNEAEGISSERRDQEFDISHLFFGHEIIIDHPITVQVKNDLSLRSLELKVKEESQEERDQIRMLIDDNDKTLSTKRVGLAIRETLGKNKHKIKGFFRLSSQGGIGFRDLDVYRRISRDSSDDTRVVQYVATDSASPRELLGLWDRILLTPLENRVLEGLKYVDKTIERIGAYAGSYPAALRFVQANRGGFKIKLKDQEKPVPIGILGDGVWRMLAIAISLVRSQNGVLLIDEIDTGLHYSVMEDLWRMIAETARQLDVQVFATTHSYDCITSLASICRADAGNENEVTIQRIEVGKTHAIPYDEGDIVTAAEHHTEMR